MMFLKIKYFTRYMIQQSDTQVEFRNQINQQPSDSAGARTHYHSTHQRAEQSCPGTAAV